MTYDFFSYADAAGSGPRGGGAILAGLSDEDWDKLIAFTARRRYKDGAAVIRAHDTERAIFFIVAGAVRIFAPQPKGADVEIARLGEGAVFGIQSFLDGGARAASAGAVGPLEVLMLSLQQFDQLAAWQPRIAIALLRDIGANMAARLRRHEATV